LCFAAYWQQPDLLYPLKLKENQALTSRIVPYHTKRRSRSRAIITDQNQLTLKQFDGLNSTITLPISRPLPGSAEIRVVETHRKSSTGTEASVTPTPPTPLGPPTLRVSKVPSEILVPSKISITGKVQYFHMRSAALKCNVNTEGGVPLPTDCIITAIGTKVNGGTVFTVFRLPLGPSKSSSFPSDFTDLKSVVFERAGVLVADALFTVYGSIIYDVIQDFFRIRQLGDFRESILRNGRKAGSLTHLNRRNISRHRDLLHRSNSVFSTKPAIFVTTLPKYT
jgi:hypothetical protein